MALSLLSSLLSSSIDSFGYQDKARIETFISWMARYLSFDYKAKVALNPEELKSIEEEKQIFHNEIGFDVNMFRHFQKTCFDFHDRIACQTTVEGLKSVLEEMEKSLWNPTFTVDVLVTALDKYILEKNKQKYTSPAA